MLTKTAYDVVIVGGGHPGGGVTGVPGHNAAREIARDFRRGRVGR